MALPHKIPEDPRKEHLLHLLSQMPKLLKGSLVLVIYEPHSHHDEQVHLDNSSLTANNILQLFLKPFTIFIPFYNTEI